VDRQPTRALRANAGSTETAASVGIVAGVGVAGVAAAIAAAAAAAAGDRARIGNGMSGFVHDHARTAATAATAAGCIVVIGRREVVPAVAAVAAPAAGNGVHVGIVGGQRHADAAGASAA